MALADTALPFGIRDIKLTPISADGVLGTAVDLPNAQTLSFSEAEDFEELRGDDKLVAVVGTGPAVEFEIEAGGISLEAYKVLVGGVTAVTGVTPNQVRKFTKKGADKRPYFQAAGKAISDSGGDIHCFLFKCKVTESLEGSFEEGGFYITSCSGQALPRTSDDALYEFRQNETAIDLAAM